MLTIRIRFKGNAQTLDFRGRVLSRKPHEHSLFGTGELCELQIRAPGVLLSTFAAKEAEIVECLDDQGGRALNPSTVVDFPPDIDPEQPGYETERVQSVRVAAVRLRVFVSAQN